MFTQTWKKYLPVIVILLKRSAESDQTLAWIIQIFNGQQVEEKSNSVSPTCN
jgi:hypothetical protein